MTTDKRQLRLTISAIFENYGIDNLALEGKIVDAVVLFFDRARKGEHPAKVRADIVDATIGYLDKQRQFEQMENRIAAAVKVTPNGGDNWNKIVRFCLDADKSGQSIERYGEWMREDKFNAPKVAQIANNPQIIKDTWTAVFSVNQQAEQKERGIVW